MTSRPHITMAIMSITRINDFEAKPGQEAALCEFLKKVITIVKTLPACQSCRLLQDPATPTRLVILEVWDSIDAHKAAAQKIPPAMFQEFFPLIATPPKGEYFQPLPADSPTKS